MLIVGGMMRMHVAALVEAPSTYIQRTVVFHGGATNLIGNPRAAVSMAFLCLGSQAAVADLLDLVPSLSNPIEIDAARANQSVYDLLTLPQEGRVPTCDPALTSDPGQGSCTGEVFRVFDRVRHLVHTANQLTGGGPTTFSLNLDQQRLGRALRWTAAEELAAQGTSATRFASSQLNSLASRISALRFGARGFRVVDSDVSSKEIYASSAMKLTGGGASADEFEIAKRWGGFIDGAMGYGRHDDTTNLATPGTEDAFDYDGVDVTAGFDYRFGGQTVVGIMLGYADRSMEFDSNASVVDASIDASGYSVMLYMLWEHDDLYVSASLGMQSLQHDLRRRIAYPSFNPSFAPIDETAFSHTDSRSTLSSINLGYTWRRGGFSLEPYLRAEYQSIAIDGFTESNAPGFDFTYGEQMIDALDSSAGLKVQQVFRPAFGIVIPFVRGEFHYDFDDDRRTIDAVYSGVVQATGLGSDANFAIATNATDDQYYLGAAGLSVVFKHGVQAFLQYQQTFALDHIDDRAVAGGVRFEF